jgi:hypothetical protein
LHRPRSQLGTPPPKQTNERRYNGVMINKWICRLGRNTLWVLSRRLSSICLGSQIKTTKKIVMVAIASAEVPTWHSSPKANQTCWHLTQLPYIQDYDTVLSCKPILKIIKYCFRLNCWSRYISPSFLGTIFTIPNRTLHLLFGNRVKHIGTCNILCNLWTQRWDTNHFFRLCFVLTFSWWYFIFTRHAQAVIHVKYADSFSAFGKGTNFNLPKPSPFTLIFLFYF